MEKSNARIPVALQAVFLASNRGQEVHTPPPGNVAIRVFKSIFYRTTATKQSKRRFFIKRRQPPSNLNSSKVASTAIPALPSKCQPSDADTLPVRDVYICQEQTNRSGLTKSTSSRSSSRSNISKIRQKSVQRDLAQQNEDNSASSVTFDDEAMFGNIERTTKNKKTPQSFLDKRMSARGYSTKRYYTLQSGYYNKTTIIQRSSYNVYIIDLVKNRNIDKLRSLFEVGLSTNPANIHGEGLINLVCRLGLHDVLKVMIEAGCDVQVSDDYGRTPLHDACWSPNPSFEVVEQLLRIDPHMLFMMDVRGSLPLAYVQEKDYKEWFHFLKLKENDIWPTQGQRSTIIAPPLTLQLPNSRPVPDPPKVLPCSILEMLASGRLSPNEVRFLVDSDDDDEASSIEGDDDYTKTMEDFDDENEDFCRASVGGYTFDFSESEEETTSSYSGYEDDKNVHEIYGATTNAKSLSNSSDCYDIVAEFESKIQPKKKNIEQFYQLPDIDSEFFLSKSKSITISPKDSNVSVAMIQKDVGNNSDNADNAKNIGVTDIVVVPFDIQYSPTTNKDEYHLADVNSTATTLSIQDTVTPIDYQSTADIDSLSNLDEINDLISSIAMNNQASNPSQKLKKRTSFYNYCVPENDDGLLFGSC